MTYHVTISEVHYDEIIFVLVDGSHQFVFYFESAHFRLQVVSSHFGRRNKNTIFFVKRSFTSTIEEKCYVCILFCFSDMKLAQAFRSKIFAQCIRYIIFVKQDMNTLERSIVRSHTVILQARDSVHTGFRHILLSQYNSQLFGTVITVVEEDNHITFFDCSVTVGIHNRFDEFICNTCIIRVLHGLNHIGSFLTYAVYKQVISFFYTFPAFVTVHSVITADDRSNLACRFFTVCRKFFDKAFTALRVSVTTIHEAVDKCIVDVIFFSDIAKFEEMNE